MSTRPSTGRSCLRTGSVSSEPGSTHWFEEVADHLGSAYLRYSFTKGTANEVSFLRDVLDLGPGDRVLDVGCGPGRHAHALAAEAALVTGVDISWRFLQVAAERPGPSFVRADARALPFAGTFDAAISLCQGAFGLTGQGPPAGADASVPGSEPDATILREIALALRPGGRLALTAFSAYFQLRYLEDSDEFDASSAVNHERTVVRDEAGREVETDLWTTCYTPRELRLMAEDAGLVVRNIWSVAPGSDGARPPVVDAPEFLLLAELPVG